jgi:hypothetical protein
MLLEDLLVPIEISLAPLAGLLMPLEVTLAPLEISLVHLEISLAPLQILLAPCRSSVLIKIIFLIIDSRTNEVEHLEN